MVRKTILTRTKPWTGIIIGQPYSKANSRKLVAIRGKPAMIKSDNARAYGRTFAMQCPVLDPMFEGDVQVVIDIYYITHRPDLDESLVLDLLQMRIYRNDRQVRRKIVTGYVDAENPRTEITVMPYR